MVKLLTLCLLIISIVSFVIAQYPIAQINCGVETHSQTTYNYFTPAPFWYHTFNSGGWHVKELRVYYPDSTIMVGRHHWFATDHTPGSFKSDYYEGSVTRDFEFIKSDETVECGRATWSVRNDPYTYNKRHRNACADSVYEVDCPKREFTYQIPATCTPNDVSACQINGHNWEWHCNNGQCLHSVDTARCLNPYVYNTFPIITRAPGQIYLGFRVADCLGNIIDLTTGSGLSIEENSVSLLPVETRQQLTVMQDSHNFVQLMISMCPRTLLDLESLISGLTNFISASSNETTFIALTVFDGAQGFVDLMQFTQDFDKLLTAVENLRNYTIREYTCNIKQSVSEKLEQMQQYLFGQPWDRLFYVIFSASSDLANYKENAAVSRLFAKERDILVYFVGQNIPNDQTSLFSTIGGAGFWNLNSGEAVISRFQALANNIRYSYTGEYLFGYCSPSRINDVMTRVNFTLPSGRASLIQGFKVNAGNFGGSCSISNTLEELCTPCSTVIKRRSFVCYDCFQSSNVSLPRPTRYSQVLLRYPEGSNITLQLPFPSQNTTTYNVYVRKNGLSNSLLYDARFMNTRNNNIELIGFNAGDLVGVLVEWGSSLYLNSYLMASGIKLAPYYIETIPPIAPPVLNTTQPVASPTRVPAPPANVVPIAVPATSPTKQQTAEPAAAQTSDGRRYFFALPSTIAVFAMTLLN